MKRFLLITTGIVLALPQAALAQHDDRDHNGGGHGGGQPHGAPHGPPPGGGGQPHQPAGPRGEAHGAPQAPPPQVNRAMAAQQAHDRHDARGPDQPRGDVQRAQGRGDDHRGDWNRGGQPGGRPDAGRPGDNRGQGYDRGRAYDRGTYRIGAGRPEGFHRYRAPAFAYPRGWGYRRWSVGLVLPALFLSSAYYWNDWNDLGIGAPPYGDRWVRYGPDLLLVNIRSGRVDDVIYDAFY